MGIGWNPRGEQMVGAIACIGFAESNRLGVYYLSGQFPEAIVEIQRSNVRNESFWIIEDYFFLQFLWDTKITNQIYNFTVTDEIYMIFAYSTLPALLNPGHGDNTSTVTLTSLIAGEGSIPFHPCDRECSENGICAPISCACSEYWTGSYCQINQYWDVSSIAIVHGVVMELCFGLAYPFGIVWKRYSKSPEHKKLVVHRNLQGNTSILLFGSLLLAVVLVNSSNQIMLLIQDTLHPIIGLTVFVLCCLQILFGLCGQKTQNRWMNVVHYLHLWIGIIFLLLGWLNCFIGIDLLLGRRVFFYIHACIVIIWLLIFIILEIRNICFNKRDYLQIQITK